MVKSCPNWHKRLSSSIELGAQHVSPHQTTIKRKKATPERRVPVAFCWGSWLSPLPKAEATAKKKRVSGSLERLHFGRQAMRRGNPGTKGPAGHLKVVPNRKADCFTLLKRITKLKCVNSDVKSVDIHPKQGCLNWPYGTMSESP